MFEITFLTIVAAGLGGGLTRGLVDYIKYNANSKTFKFNLLYFLLMMFLSSMVGLLSAAAINGMDLSFAGVTALTPTLAFIVGYAGGDFIENVYKILIKKTTIY